MSVAETKKVMDRYFDLMGRQADFSECCSVDVTWLIADRGEVIHGAATVRDYIIDLHDATTDMHTSRFVVGDESAYLEGDCAASDLGGNGRVHYCVAYDIRGDAIVAMRCYGLGG
jgi:hypothetical protein